VKTLLKSNSAYNKIVGYELMACALPVGKT